MRFISAIDSLTEHIGKAIAWLFGVMALVTFIVVILRYGFNLGAILLQEAVANDRRPLGRIVADDRHEFASQPSQRDLHTAERMQTTSLAEPTTVGDAPLSADLLRSKSRRAD